MKVLGCVRCTRPTSIRIASPEAASVSGTGIGVQLTGRKANSPKRSLIGSAVPWGASKMVPVSGSSKEPGGGFRLRTKAAAAATARSGRAIESTKMASLLVWHWGSKHAGGGGENKLEAKVRSSERLDGATANVLGSDLWGKSWWCISCNWMRNGMNWVCLVAIDWR